MLANYFTKPLQENLFRRFRDVIMGYKHINDLLLDPGFLFKEHVEILNNIVIKKSETNNNKDVKENGNKKVNKMKEVVSKDIMETSTGNRTYRDVCVIGK